MWTIIKTEIIYSKHNLLVVTGLLLAFSLFALLEIHISTDANFVGRYLWTMIIALGIYIVIYQIWSTRIRTKRDRFHHQLPISVSKISFARWLFGILPLLSVIIYILLLKLFITTVWQIQSERIIGQLGFFTAFLAMLFVLRDISFYLADKSNIIKILANISFLAISAFGVIFIIILTSPILIEPLFNNGSEILFFIWGIVLSSASVIIYKKRKSFLE